MITSGSWNSAFASDSVLTAAMLDRVLHHATIVSISGESYRLKDTRIVCLFCLLSRGVCRQRFQLPAAPFADRSMGNRDHWNQRKYHVASPTASVSTEGHGAAGGNQAKTAPQ